MAVRTNEIGLEKTDYKGRPTTLCQGCGHNSISSQIMSACYEMAIKPERIIKLSGIGCSSKSPAYFLSRSHGFNSLHGRMPSIGTGAMMANHKLIAIGVSGDGDSASIGMGQFVHVMRRNVPMVYIIENNGVYGLTKGQFSATADKGQTLKREGTNPYMPIDLCMQAMASNAGFIARSFAGDPNQVKELIKAAVSYQGTAVLDIISPCVTFNNRDESTKSYAWGKEHETPIHDVTYVPVREDIQVDYEPGQVTEVELHDGSTIVLKKLDHEYDPMDRASALRLLEDSASEGYLATGLIYLNTDQESLVEAKNLVDEPLASLPESRLRPTEASLQGVMKQFA